MTPAETAALPEARRRILSLVEEFCRTEHAPRPFVPDITPVPVSGRVFGPEEMANLVDASLDFWLTTGRYNDAFEDRLAKFVGVNFALTVNSGSSANLLAVAALTSPTLGDRALKPGDEVITVAAGFPTTVNPLLIHGLVPVFVDILPATYNIDPALIAGAVTDRTRAVMVAHTLGNPFDLDAVALLCREKGLWLVEDCCDALGSTYQGKKVGTFGDVATLSFYPAHHITMGEGGAVLTRNAKLKRVLESVRDWGRDCFCPTGKDNTCGKRFGWQLGDLPDGYDHKYIYSHVGYNLKITDMQAAVGLAQLDRLPGFIEARKANFLRLKERLVGLQDHLLLPEATAGSDPSWFGFPVTLRRESPKGRVDLLRHLDRHRIATRLLFGGNLTKQPYFRSQRYRIAGSLARTDEVMERTFWLGVFPGLTPPMLDHVAARLTDFFRAG